MAFEQPWHSSIDSLITNNKSNPDGFEECFVTATKNGSD